MHIHCGIWGIERRRECLHELIHLHTLALRSPTFPIDGNHLLFGKTLIESIVIAIICLISVEIAVDNCRVRMRLKLNWFQREGEGVSLQMGAVVEWACWVDDADCGI